jgi:hypothetical protein
MRICLILAATFMLPAATFAGDVVFHSGPTQTHLLELYTSEGCSSCPPAEERLSNFRSNPDLWTQIVPVAFHVDYWNGLGWPDRFSSPAFTQRQQDYASGWGGDSVYTPEFVLDGREFQGGEISPPSGSAGNLTATLKPAGDLTIHYDPASSASSTYEVHVATLGMGIESDVRAGENGGRRLHHDFLVLHLLFHPIDPAIESATVSLPADGAKALAIWITRPGSQVPIQAAGGSLQ